MNGFSVGDVAGMKVFQMDWLARQVVTPSCLDKLLQAFQGIYLAPAID
jgi:hypothetical protein